MSCISKMKYLNDELWYELQIFGSNYPRLQHLQVTLNTHFSTRNIALFSTIFFFLQSAFSPILHYLCFKTFTMCLNSQRLGLLALLLHYYFCHRIFLVWNSTNHHRVYSIISWYLRFTSKSLPHLCKF